MKEKEGRDREFYKRQKFKKKKKERTKNVAHTGELVPSARCEEYLCKVKQKREELEKVYTYDRQIDRYGRKRRRFQIETITREKYNSFNKNHNNEGRRVRMYERETEKERGTEMGDRKVKRQQYTYS